MQLESRPIGVNARHFSFLERASWALGHIGKKVRKKILRKMQKEEEVRTLD